MNRTLAIVKPDAVAANYTGKIIDRILEAGFRILAMRMVRLNKDTAGAFYEVHKERPFYADLCEFMSSDRAVAIALEKDNAVADFRKLIGATNPDDAEEGTIRKQFASSLSRNAVHGSDSDENAAIEIGFFFSRQDLVTTA